MDVMSRGRKLALLIGVVIVFLASGVFLYATPSTCYLVYPGSILAGIGSTIVMIMSHSMANDLVGEHVSTAAFVYGVFSLMDKLANGILIMYVQVLKQRICPVGDIGSDEPCSQLLRHVLVYLPALSAIAASFTSWFVRVEAFDGPEQRLTLQLHTSYKEPTDYGAFDWAI